MACPGWGRHLRGWAPAGWEVWGRRVGVGGVFGLGGVGWRVVRRGRRMTGFLIVLWRNKSCESCWRGVGLGVFAHGDLVVGVCLIGGVQCSALRVSWRFWWAGVSWGMMGA
ncbi:hypothetical protein RE0327_47930 (plasmid) [Prescottella equi]|nr:hypothetical protein RE0327_47930 [Prescottella equi]